tara:strand:- start:13555 stop:15393 length:1839 start_codon:yes stop_codon:yes gene_type:complete
MEIKRIAENLSKSNTRLLGRKYKNKIMKNSTPKSPFLLLFLALANIAMAQTTNWNWLRNSENADTEWGQGAVADAQGNVYHAGIFTGSTVLNGDTIHNWGSPLAQSGYVSRISTEGTPADNWTLVISTIGSGVSTIQNNIRGLSVDNAGNTYFQYQEISLGFFSLDTIQIGPNHQWLKTGPGFISLLVKLDPLGNVVWFKSFRPGGNAGGVDPLYTASNGQGEVYIMGRLGTGGPNLVLDTISLSPIGSFGHFLAKIDLNGDFLWAKGFGSKSTVAADLQLTVNEQDEAFVSGAWKGDTFFMESLQVVNPTPGEYDRYIAKFSGNGQAQWLVNEGGQGEEWAAAMAPKASGGVMCLSILDNAANVILNNGSLSVSPPGLILTQYDAQGNFQSHTQYSINSVSEFRSFYRGCVLAGNGSEFFMSANFSDAQLSINGTILNNAGGNLGSKDAIVAKIDTAGAILWLSSIGGDEDDEIFSLDYSASNGLTIGGSTFSSELIFGDDTLVNTGFLTAEAFVTNVGFSGIGLKEVTKPSQISLYPNPSSDRLYFDLEDPAADQITVSVQNLLGQTVLEKSMDTKNAALFINVNTLSPGVYMLKMKDGSKSYTGRFIKK